MASFTIYPEINEDTVTLKIITSDNTIERHKMCIFISIDDSLYYGADWTIDDTNVGILLLENMSVIKSVNMRFEFRRSDIESNETINYITYIEHYTYDITNNICKFISNNLESISEIQLLKTKLDELFKIITKITEH